MAIKYRSIGLTFFSTGLLCTLALPTPLSLSQEVFTTEGQTFEEIIAQQTSGTLSPLPEPIDSPASKEIQEKSNEFKKELKDFKDKEITRLRGTNQRFSITFIVAGIVLTLITTALGAVESQNTHVLKWTKYAIVTIGACSAAFQALNSAFPVTRRAGVYATIGSEITILEFKINDVTNDVQLKEIKNEFYNLIRRAGEAESTSEQAKQNQ
jgi:hypothetical protein